MGLTDLERLAGLSVAHLLDACRAVHAPFAVAHGELRPLVPFTRVWGTAVTLRLSVAEGTQEYAPQANRHFALATSVERGVAVVRNDVIGFDTLGAFDAQLAMASGYVGYVTQGSVRDTHELSQLPLAVFATAIGPDCIRQSDLPAETSIGFEFGGVVDVAGMRVGPGDIVVGDNDGVAAFPAAHLARVVESAEGRLADEARQLERLRRGATVAEILAARAHRASGDANEGR